MTDKTGEVISKIKQKEAAFGKAISLRLIVLNEYTYYKIFASAYYEKIPEEAQQHMLLEQVHSAALVKQRAKALAGVFKQQFPDVDVSIHLDSVE
ncbi:hypothetical protein [Bacillus sp. 165]|uniref:hypothetical protein n=1 Tax=Bacillus sp. 165 TaxID=1529117 RepID=UPI001ADB9EBA|nr:hypothetical protein [Bacillus sp. 165]MBO9130812.1 hypothetical protein [Bacillus sp. 165]